MPSDTYSKFGPGSANESINESEARTVVPISSSNTNAEHTIEVDFISNSPKQTSDMLKFVSVQQIRKSPYQTREIISDQELETLSDSVRRAGIIQPILIRPISSESANTQYELVAGERRLRAARLAGISSVPAIVQKLTDREAAEFSVVENAQRENLNPIEQAKAYNCLAKKFKITQKEISEIVGVSRAAVANTIRLLQLPEEVRELLISGELSAGHGRLLLQLEDSEDQLYYAQKTISAGLSVAALSKKIERDFGEDEEPEVDEKEIATLARQETRVRNLLDVEGVSLTKDSEGRKRISIVFDNEAAWKRFFSRINQ